MKSCAIRISTNRQVGQFATSLTPAWELGSIIRQRFINEKLPLGLSGNIQIRAAGHIAHGDALVYFAAVVGSIPPGNCTIVSGKANVVTYFGKSSFLTRIKWVTV